MKLDPVGIFSASFIWKLRCIEWLFIAVHLMMTITAGGDRLPFRFAAYIMFIFFSWKLPVDFPLKYRQIYVWSAISVIVGVNFLDVSLDLLLYLYLAKSFFLLGRKRTIYLTAIAGIGCVASECFSEMQKLQQLSIEFEPPYGFGNYNLSVVLVFSLGLYIAVSIFTIFFSSTIVAERQSRQKAEALAEQVEIMANYLERTRFARDIHD